MDTYLGRYHSTSLSYPGMDTYLGIKVEVIKVIEPIERPL